MITLTDTLKINTTSEKVYNGLIKLFSSPDHYNKWHDDHVKSNWLKGEPFDVDSILYIEEYIHGELHKMKLRCTKNILNRRIEYKLSFPMSLICPKGSFIIQPKEGGSIFTATLSFRFGLFIQKFASGRVEALRKHMKEEGENLKRLVENEFIKN